MSRSAIAAAGIGLALVATACDDLTKVTNTGIVLASSENNAAGAAARAAGAARQFYSIVSNMTETTGAFTDEVNAADCVGQHAEGFILDARRAPTPNYQPSSSGNFTSVSSTLGNLRTTVSALQQYAPTQKTLLGQMYAYQGFMELLLAEQYCNGVPLSTIVDGVVNYGSGTPTAEIYALALAHLDSAITLSAGNAPVLNLATVGKARVLLDIARFADAATAVAAVPTNFTFNLEFGATSASGQVNIPWSYVNISSYTGVGDRQGGTTWFPGNGNGLDFVSAKDPRVPTNLVGLGLDGFTPRYNFSRFTGYGSPIALATGIEARLIQAEAALQANNNDSAPTGSGWLGTLNALRATAISPGMTPLADPGNYAARVDLLFRERAFWMFLTTHRMADMRRLVRQYGRAADSVFPSGLWKDNQPYGTEVNFIPPVSESINPNFKGCIDRKA
jgi:starch-binding outer membrane protein, SusD/RagB family